jgi:hypothetical protein
VARNKEPRTLVSGQKSAQKKNRPPRLWRAVSDVVGFPANQSFKSAPGLSVRWMIGLIGYGVVIACQVVAEIWELTSLTLPSAMQTLIPGPWGLVGYIGLQLFACG